MAHVATQIVVLAVVLGHLVPAAAVPGPIVTSLSLKPSSISGGSGATSTGTVTLSAAAPAGGTSVALSSSISAYQKVAQLALRVHDDAPGLTALAGEIFRDPRTGKIRLRASGGEEVTFFREL